MSLSMFDAWMSLAIAFACSISDARPTLAIATRRTVSVGFGVFVSLRAVSFLGLMRVKSATRNHVLHVLLVCTKFQMLRVDARPVVAFVPYFHSLRNWAVGLFPSFSMRQDSFLPELSTTGVDAVSVVVQSAGPLNTFHESTIRQEPGTS